MDAGRFDTMLPKLLQERAVAAVEIRKGVLRLVTLLLAARRTEEGTNQPVPVEAVKRVAVDAEDMRGRSPVRAALS